MVVHPTKCENRTFLGFRLFNNKECERKEIKNVYKMTLYHE